MPYRCRVYIIDLSGAVLERARFRECNVDYCEGKLCMYLGQTVIDVEKRFEQHKAGIRENRFLREYSRKLRTNDIKGIRPRKTRVSIARR